MTIQRMKIAPHLFIGLGGCGSQIVNEIARKLKRRKEEVTVVRFKLDQDGKLIDDSIHNLHRSILTER